MARRAARPRRVALRAQRAAGFLLGGKRRPARGRRVACARWATLAPDRWDRQREADVTVSLRPPSPRISAVLSDVDGTLVTTDKVLSARAEAAVAALHASGIAFAIISARPPR